jgi:pumilio RNA-binding family
MNNNNINNQLKYLQMLSNYNNNNIYNNQFPNLNQENLYFNNNKNIISYPNQNLQIYNNYNPYQNNLINNMNINNYNNNMFNNNYNQDNNNIYEKNNLNLEQILIDIPPYELIDKCCVFAKFQSGCRFLQDYLTENANNSSLIKAMFEKILEHIKELSKGQFSHYFVKKILPLLNEFQRMKLIKTLSPVIEDISTNQYGTKIIQDIIDLIKTEKEYNLMLNIITPYIKQLIIDLNGTQIIYKLITKSKNRKIIEDCICKNIKEIALSKKGSNFLIKYFEFADEKDTLNIKKNILMNLKDIIMDQFGNYVIQHILLKTKSEILQNFVDEIKVNLILYSNNKFASNAVEKCFQNENIKNDVIKLFMVKDIFNSIILDKFGNYVAQRAIGAADDKDRKILIDLLKLIIPELKNKYFGEKLLSKIQFLYPNFF